MIVFESLLFLSLIGAQLCALVIVGRRLARGRHRLPPAEPLVRGLHDTSVSVVVPARNEAQRIGPCLAGLEQQGAPLGEVIVVDGGSTDATPQLVDAAALRDPRIRGLPEPPRPRGAVGRPWAIAAGCAVARGEWILVVDADAVPQPGMVAGAVSAARAHGLDVVSFAPRIVAPSVGARWLQPAFLTTLVYRFGPAGVDDAQSDRVMANGQCMLMRRSVLERAGGYAVVADSYCDDVRIARHFAHRGARVGFLDGPRLLDVVMYETARDTWNAWPRSLSMRDTTSLRWHWLDALLLLLAQAAPLPLLLGLLIGGWTFQAPIALLAAAGVVNGLLVVLRVLLAVATAHSFARRGLVYWLSPLADPPAVLRVIEALLRRPREWRGQSRETLTEHAYRDAVAS